MGDSGNLGWIVPALECTELMSGEKSRSMERGIHVSILPG
jgi:hypothetical protein